MKMLRIKAVLELIGLSERKLYEMISDGQFPRPVQLTAKAVAWPEKEVEAWLQAKMDARDTQVAA